MPRRSIGQTGPVRIVAAPDKFRGTADAAQIAAAIALAAAEHGMVCDQIPLADGGEGTLDALGGPNRTTLVSGPLGDPVAAQGRLERGRAVIEMARASGLELAGGAQGNDPIAASTTGTGELISAALEAGARRIVVGVGGSATTDGGLGAIRAVTPRQRLRGVELLVACDVRTTFIDAATIFGPQKGASAKQVELLRRRLERLAQVYRDDFGVEVTEVAGGGAAGGLGGGLYATELCILGARTRVGKTAFGVQLLANARRAGWKCLLFSCEMRPLELQMRYASSLTSYHLDRIRAKDLDPYQWGEVDRAAQQWIDLDVPVVYGVLSVTKIERELALHPDVDFILCDYIQKYRPPEGQRYGQREQEVAAVAGALKDLAMRRNVIVLALAQLNREAEKGGESRLPLLTDIRESDAISQDANNILLLHRDLGGLDKMAATLILAKNRSGGEQVVKMRMSPSFTFLAETRAWEK